MLPGSNPIPPSKHDIGATDRTQMFDKIDHFELWFASTWRLLWRGAIIVVAVFLVIFIVRGMNEAANEKLCAEFSAIESNTQLTPAQKATELESKIAQNPNAAPAALARMFVANQAMEVKDYAKAIATYDELYNDAKVYVVIRARAAINKAYAQQATGDLEASVATLNDVVNNDMDVNQAFLIECYYAMALVYQKQGDKAKVTEMVSKFRSQDIVRHLTNHPLMDNIQAFIAVHEATKTSIPAGIGADLSKLPSMPSMPTAPATPTTEAPAAQ